jgi:predicted Zn finger-like uncharacterized protein
MQTTCPECRTSFRVSQEHLGARRGLVRCGTCNAVFNAYDTLLPELEEPPAEAAPASARKPVEPVPAAVESTPAVHLVDAYAEIDRLVQADISAPDQTEEPTVTDTVTISAPAAAQEDMPRESGPDILLQPLPVAAAQRPGGWKTLFNTIFAILLVGLLLLQAAYFMRADLVAVAPATRPALEWLCQPLNCVVPLPRQLGQDAIAASSLEHDPEQKSRVRLSFLLTNRTGQTQAWPQIMLTLSDVRQAPVAQQVFRPQTYLPKDVKIAAGMPNGAEREIRLDLDFGNLAASGYALSLIYP